MDWKLHKITLLGVSFHAMRMVGNQGRSDTHVRTRKKSVHIWLGGITKINTTKEVFMKM